MVKLAYLLLAVSLSTAIERPAVGELQFAATANPLSNTLERHEVNTALA